MKFADDTKSVIVASSAQSGRIPQITLMKADLWAQKIVKWDLPELGRRKTRYDRKEVQKENNIGQRWEGKMLTHREKKAFQWDVSKKNKLFIVAEVVEIQVMVLSTYKNVSIATKNSFL